MSSFTFWGYRVVRRRADRARAPVVIARQAYVIIDRPPTRAIELLEAPVGETTKQVRRSNSRQGLGLVGGGPTSSAKHKERQ
ncbi:hypothetical protein [Ferrimicrobium sp.]|uniref:hypothetical protein n=1 Tax=Ferrimicrobium sp. TaxID=2926050 RepID=UPI00262CC2B1|nr:hypothetical protein [Ferrimicrobium sp.]